MRGSRPASTPAALRLRSLVLSAVLAGGLLAGCGSGNDGASLSKDEYLTRVRTIQVDAQPADRLYFSLVTGEDLTRAECGEKAAEFHRELERILGEIEELRPPAEIEDLHQEFIGAVRESVASVGRTSEAAANGTVRCGPDINRQLYGLASTKRAQDVLARLAQRGYVILGE